jgi:hypothetical protein
MQTDELIFFRGVETANQYPYETTILVREVSVANTAAANSLADRDLTPLRLVDCLKCLHDFGSRCGCTGQIFELKNFEI